MASPVPLPPLLASAFHDLPAAPLCVGFSGGLDSTVLLHLLAALPAARARGLRAIHVHHGLHPDAALWSRQCIDTCAQLDIPLAVESVTVAETTGEGLEAAARHARRAAYARHLTGDDVLVLAHHLDDQAETFLLRALRGSGPEGLAAMRRWSTLEAHRLWRPLLDTPRDALRAHALQQGLRWLDDPSNTDLRFDRNFLRACVMPVLRQRWPAADALLGRSARHCDSASALLLEDDARQLAQVATADPAVLSRARLLRLPQPRRARVLRHWVRQLGLPPLPADAVSRIETEVLGARADACPTVEWEGSALRAWRDLLHAGSVCPPPPHGWRCTWTGEAPLAIPGGGSLALEGASRLPAPLTVTLRTGGERITLPGRAHSHALKHVLQDLGVPPWEREHLPVLRSAEGEVVAAGDLAYSSKLDDWLRQAGARLCWVPPTRAPRD